MGSVVDVPALIIGIVVALGITAALLVAHRGDNHRRGWIVAGIVVLAVGTLAAIDVARESPRETNFTTPFLTALIATIATLGIIRATRRVHPWLRAGMVFVTAFVTLLAGLLLVSTYIAKLLPF